MRMLLSCKIPLFTHVFSILHAKILLAMESINQTLFSEDKIPQYVVRVAVPLFLPKMLDYKWNDTSVPLVGDMVEVEVGRKKYHALVMEVLTSSPYDKLKKAAPLAEKVHFNAKVAEFYRWVSRYTLSMPGDPVRSALVSAAVPERPALQMKWKISPQADILSRKDGFRMTSARGKVLKSVQITPKSVMEWAADTGVSESVVRSLIKQGFFEEVAVREEDDFQQLDVSHAPTLNPYQQAAAAEIIASLEQDTFKTFLLDGIMGSGKTEVYFEAIERLLEKDEKAQILVLVPEISLTPQWTSRFEKRFGFAPVCWHSGLSEGVRRKNWWQILENKARVVVGARSSLFLPYQNLKLIIVDEEHDSSYKQEDVFRYNGRDMAIVCGRIWKASVVLASATPSLETWKNALDQKYKHLTLPHRHGGATLPKMRLVDMKENGPKGDRYVSDLMVREIARRLALKEQSLVFLNRRGVAPLLICKGCGERKGCPSCSTSLVVHEGHLECHHCGFMEPWPKRCPKCHKEEMWRAFGPGTRKIKKELEEAFPEATIAVADSDSITTPAQIAHLVDNMESGKIDILIGTQMVAKGHHFSNLTFVGVVDGDMGLAHGEMRASERTFQLLMQVAGRAGRESTEGEVMLQSYSPEHPLFQALKSYDRQAFYKIELENRKQWMDPPYAKQVAVILSGEYENEVAQVGHMLVRTFPEVDGVEILGPAPAPLARLKDKFRFRLLIKSTKPLQNIIIQWLGGVEIPRRVKLQVDVDPVSFF